MMCFLHLKVSQTQSAPGGGPKNYYDDYDNDNNDDDDGEVGKCSHVKSRLFKSSAVQIILAKLSQI